MLAQYSTPVYGSYTYSSGAIATAILVGIVPIAAMVASGIHTLATLEGSLWQVMFVSWPWRHISSQ